MKISTKKGLNRGYATYGALKMDFDKFISKKLSGKWIVVVYDRHYGAGSLIKAKEYFLANVDGRFWFYAIKSV